jgi:hypothetical protein
LLASGFLKEIKALPMYPGCLAMHDVASQLPNAGAASLAIEYSWQAAVSPRSGCKAQVETIYS